MPRSISVLGAGSWGTALALLAARNGCDTLLWTHNQQQFELLSQQRENQRYLPGFLFPQKLKVTASLAEVVTFSPLLLITVPSHAFKATLQKIKPCLSDEPQIAWATKGFNSENGSLMSEAVSEVLGGLVKKAVLSGPTFAKEVAADLPTAITIASESENLISQLSDILHNQRFRTYSSTDIIGVQVGGASKNVLAIAAGIADGLGFGANTRAALITRGLTEIMRLGIKMGGQSDTFMGLTGLGDLILTCTDNQSRNRRFGLALGQGHNRQNAMLEIAQEIEGISAAKAAYGLAKKFNIEMPITEQVYNVLFKDMSPEIAVNNLLTREKKSEI
jgi:glycerol-3-phosphate dehydrogenase (NAD(P)+)